MIFKLLQALSIDYFDPASFDQRLWRAGIDGYKIRVPNSVICDKVCKTYRFGYSVLEIKCLESIFDYPAEVIPSERYLSV